MARYLKIYKDFKLSRKFKEIRQRNKKNYYLKEYVFKKKVTPLHKEKF